MTAADAREELEAAIWATDPATLGTMRYVLTAADRYAKAYAAETLEAFKRDTITGRRAALIEGDGKHYGQAS